MAPAAVLTAATIQYLTALTFVLAAVIAYRYGDQAQAAAEAEVERQGLPAGVLTQHKIKFSESALETLFPLGIAACLAVLATLNLAGDDAGRVLTWVLQSILLVAGGLTTAAQVFTVSYVRAALRRSGDTSVQLDAGALIDAARRAFPPVLHPLVVTRFVLVTAGSALLIALLATPSASTHFS